MGAQPRDAVLAGIDPAPGKFVGDEPVAKFWVIGMDLAGCVDQMSVVPVLKSLSADIW